MTIKNLTLVLFSFFTITAIAQESKPKVKEVGIILYNFQQYGLQYNVGNGTNMWRFRVINGGISIMHLDNYDLNRPISTENINANFSAAIGREKRKTISPNMKFIYGMEISTNYYFYRIKDNLDNINRSHQLSAGIVGVIGIRHDINTKFYVNAELLPSLLYRFNSTNSNIPTYFGAANKGFSFGFGNNSALLSVGIKF